MTLHHPEGRRAGRRGEEPGGPPPPPDPFRAAAAGFFREATGGRLLWTGTAGRRGDPSCVAWGSALAGFSPDLDREGLASLAAALEARFRAAAAHAGLILAPGRTPKPSYRSLESYYRLVKGGSAGGGAGFIPPEELVRRIAEKTRRIFRRQYHCLEEEVLPALAAGGAPLLRPGDWSPAQRDYLAERFLREIYPLLTPLRIEEGEPLPAIESIRLHAAFLLAPGEEVPGEEPSGEDRVSIIRIPGVLERI
ncbi:MAG: hypothetical protein LBG06_00375, partial [Deltaproteobacteria bacterium]|nr:hypothetical protein [Deltaproteobacteria bacterium]